jgi:3-methyladenine DNA glycosylase AlkD
MKDKFRDEQKALAEALIDELWRHSEPKKLARLEIMGVPVAHSVGVSKAVLRKMARSIPKDNLLASALWSSGYHEARLLAVLCAEPESLQQTVLQNWLDSVDSWGLCDHICRDLIRFRSDASELVFLWASDQRLYFRRAAMASIANLAVHREHLSKELVERFVRCILHISDDGRLHVKKAASLALRALGKRGFFEHDIAVAAAVELLERESKPANWIGRNALKELETLLEVPERKRLLSSKSKMGKQAVVN